MSTSNIEYLDSKVQQMNLATFSEEQPSFQLEKSRTLEIESENNALKLQLKTKEQSWNKDRAILTQKIELLESHIYESKIRQDNLSKMNEAFMNTLNDLTANPKNFSNKMLKDLQQLFENRIQMDPDAESKLQKNTLTIKQQQEEIEELKKKIAQQDQEIALLKRQLSDKDKVIEKSLQRQQQDLATISSEKQKECKNLEKENIKMKQMYEKEILALQKKHSEAISQIAQLQQGKSLDNDESYNGEVTRLNNIIDAMSQNHKLEIDLIRQQTQNEVKMIENKQRILENSSNNQALDQDSQTFILKVQQLENEKNQLSQQLQSVLSQLHQVTEENQGISSTLQLKDQQIDELKNKVSSIQSTQPLTCQDFFDVELQISRIEPERSKRRSIINESLISNMTPMNGNRDSNNPMLNLIGNGLGFNGLPSDNGLSNNTSSNNYIQQHNPNSFHQAQSAPLIPNSTQASNNNHNSNTNQYSSNQIYQTPSMGQQQQHPVLQNNYSSTSINSQNAIPQGYGLCQSIQFNSNNNNQDHFRRVEQPKSTSNQQVMFARQGSLANSDLSNCDTFGNPSAVKNKRVISASTSSNNLGREFLLQNNLISSEHNTFGQGQQQQLQQLQQLQQQQQQQQNQQFLKTDQSSQSQSSLSQNQHQQITMDTSIEKRSIKAGQIVQKKKLQSSENMESQTSLHNLKTEDTVHRRERTSTTQASYHHNSALSNSNSQSFANLHSIKHAGSAASIYQSSSGSLQQQANKALAEQQLAQQKILKNINMRNNSANINRVGGNGNDLQTASNQNIKAHNKNQSLSNVNNPLSVGELKKSIIDSTSNLNANNTNNNINSSMQCNNNNNLNITHYNSNQSLISQGGNLLGASQSFIKNNPMTQSSLLNQEQSFLVRAIQENMQERMTLEEKMKNLETEVQNYIMINQQKQKSPMGSSFSSLVQQVMKELYSKQLNKSIFTLSKEERENVLKHEIKSLVDKFMIKPLQQRQQSQENKSMIINQSMNKSISIEESILKDTKSPRYHQNNSNIGVSNLLNSSILSQSKGFLNFVNQNKENSSFNPKLTGSLKSNSNLLGRIQVKPNSTTNFQSQLHLQGISSSGSQQQNLLGSNNFFDKKVGSLNLSTSNQVRNSRQLN